jgi:hypothetical protein
MYQLTHVTKLYAKGRRTVPAVRDLSLEISDGEWLAIQGPLLDPPGHQEADHHVIPAPAGLAAGARTSSNGAVSDDRQ